MGLIEDFKAWRYKRRCVYCSNCNRAQGSKCITGYTPHPIRPQPILGDCLKLNPDNKCSRYLGWFYDPHEGLCQNKAGTPWTPYWCLRCDKLRRATIAQQLKDLLDSFPKPEPLEGK